MESNESNIANIHKGPPALIFCAGGIGSGKSFLLKNLRRQGLSEANAVFIAFDDFMHAPGVDLNRDFHDEKHNGHQEQFLAARTEKFTQALATGKHIVIETHLENGEQLRAFEKTARARNYRIIGVGCVPSPAGFFNLRRYHDRITPQSHEAMMSQITFLERWKSWRSKMDYSALFEREYTKHSEGLALLEETFNTHAGPRVVVHDTRRLREVVDGWEIINRRPLDYTKPEHPTQLVTDGIHKGKTLGQNMHSPAP